MAVSPVKFFIEKLNEVRLPPPLINRWVYGLVAALSAALVWSFFLCISSGWLSGSPIGIFPTYFLGLIAVPTICAFLLFPTHPVGRMQMKNYGAMVVFLSFVVYSILAGIYFGFESESQSILGKTVMSLGLMLVAFLLFVSFGSVLTFGSPWFFAIFLSALFAAEDTLIVSEAGKTLDEFVSDSEKQRP